VRLLEDRVQDTDKTVLLTLCVSILNIPIIAFKTKTLGKITCVLFGLDARQLFYWLDWLCQVSFDYPTSNDLKLWVVYFWVLVVQAMFEADILDSFLCAEILTAKKIRQNRVWP
jgi:hypothetical protein